LKPFGTPGIGLPVFQYWMNSRPQLRWSIPAEATGPVYGPSSAISAALQDGPAATAATLLEPATATDAATAQTAVTANTATTMAFLINMPSFVPPPWIRLV
jgi:hypothetical protein